MKRTHAVAMATALMTVLVVTTALGETINIPGKSKDGTKPSSESTGVVGPSMSPSGPTKVVGPSMSPSGPTKVVGPSMSPSGPVAQTVNKPTTPSQSLPQQKFNRPEFVKYTAYLRSVQGPLPSRLGGWACTGSSCTLRTNGPGTEAKMLELCNGLWHLRKNQRSVSFSIEKFRADPGRDLSALGLKSCLR